LLNSLRVGDDDCSLGLEVLGLFWPSFIFPVVRWLKRVCGLLFLDSLDCCYWSFTFIVSRPRQKRRGQGSSGRGRGLLWKQWDEKKLTCLPKLFSSESETSNFSCRSCCPRSIWYNENGSRSEVWDELKAGTFIWSECSQWFGCISHSSQSNLILCKTSRISTKAGREAGHIGRWMRGWYQKCREKENAFYGYYWPTEAYATYTIVGAPFHSGSWHLDTGEGRSIWEPSRVFIATFEMIRIHHSSNSKPPSAQARPQQRRLLSTTSSIASRRITTAHSILRYTTLPIIESRLVSLHVDFVVWSRSSTIRCCIEYRPRFSWNYVVFFFHRAFSSEFSTVPFDQLKSCSNRDRMRLPPNSGLPWPAADK